MTTYVDGTCALELPSSYSLVDEDEMIYIDGGSYYLSKKECTGIITAVGFTPSALALAAVTVSIAKKIITRVSAAIGGFVGWAAGKILGAALTYVSAQLVIFGKGVLAGAKYKGVDFTFDVNFGKNNWGLTYSARK